MSLRPLILPALTGLALVLVSAQSLRAQEAAITPDEEVLANVNGTPITAKEVRAMYDQFPIAPEARPLAYTDILNVLINNELIFMQAKENSEAVSEETIDQQIDQLAEVVTQQGADLDATLQQRGQTREDLREEFRREATIQQYFSSLATEEAVDAFIAANPTIFDGTRVRASHILVEVPPDADSGTSEDLRKRLANLKTLIERQAKKEKETEQQGADDNSPTGPLQRRFAEAANKYSQDDQNLELQNGGDLGYFTRRNMLIEEFAAKAFEAKINEIVGPVETEFGWHLILVTDRREGRLPENGTPESDQLNQAARGLFVEEQVKQIIAEQRKTADIAIKPMPANLFPPIEEADDPDPTPGGQP